jgi:hypothetical protein
MKIKKSGKGRIPQEQWNTNIDVENVDTVIILCVVHQFVYIHFTISKSRVKIKCNHK